MTTRTETLPVPVIPTDRFLTPGGQIDFPNDTGKQDALNKLWNANLSGFTAQGITGNPWTMTNSSPQPWYYDPTTTDTSTAQYASITWSALPGRIAYYLFPDLQKPNDDVYSLADTGKDTNGKPFGKIPANPFDSNDKTMENYGPYGPRGWQDEYCEWSIQYDTNGKIVRIDFTCENPEYFNSLWMIDPNRVLEIYQTTLDKPQIQLEDLYLKDLHNNVVIDPSTGRPAYDPLNKWNNGPKSTSTGGGAMHLTSTPNTIQTEIGLAAAATTPRVCGNSNQTKLIKCAQYGQVGRNSDPHIGQIVNQAVNTSPHPAKLTLANPPGLYIQTPDFKGNKVTTPDGTDPATFWKPTRGNTTLRDAHGRQLPGTFTLHATFMVPPGHPYTVSEIQINGKAIKYASQLVELIKMQIVGQKITQSSSAPPDAQACPVPATMGAQPLQLFHQAVFVAMYVKTYRTVVNETATLASNSTLIAPWVQPGATNVPMLLVLDGIDPSNPPTISFGEGVTVTNGQIHTFTYTIPGNSYPSQNHAMPITVSVSPDAAPGLRGCYATNPGQMQSESKPMPALLHIKAL